MNDAFSEYFCFRRRQNSAELLSKVVFERAKRIRSCFTRNKENLNVNYGGIKFSDCIFFQTCPDERLLIFENSTWVGADRLSDVELIRRYKTAVDSKVQ